MTAEPAEMRSYIAWSTPDRIVVRGRDFPSEILGRMDLASFSFLQITGREPSAAQAHVYEAIVMTLIEHGITPSSLAARLTYDGAPESVQGAVAAGLLGLGSVFVGSAEDAARMLQEAPFDHDIPALAERIVEARYASGAKIPGVGHPFHKPVDPRAARLWDIAQESGLGGRHVALMSEISVAAERRSGRALPVNATGAVAALACEIGLPWQAVRGVAVMARAIGLVGHVLEESVRPIGLEVWRRADRDATRHQRVGEENP